MKKSSLVVFAALAFWTLAHPQASEARISLFFPWMFQERPATQTHALDQSVGFQTGWSGVSPAGGSNDSTHILFPYEITYGVMKQLEVGAGWGLQYLDRKNQSDQFGIIDLQLAAKYRLFDADRVKRMPGLDVEMGFSFPTASFEKGLGTGAFGILFGWGMVLPLDPLRMHAGMGFRLNTENSDDVRLGHVFSYNVGASLPIKQVHKDFAAIGELKGFNHGKSKFRGNAVGSASDELYLAPGASFNLPHNLRMLGQLLIGLTGDSSDAGFSFELQF
ncbi:MAG: hypothetical protein A2901_00705 [Elusimicrobia bacterium RIFCSPLOWO2_01_FULL_54_10]|nr:MAG: hypothetical protein A2901_00705 [Elusimicrobia bacterium RIFCSPLOWO2_01_FULL_54_10]